MIQVTPMILCGGLGTRFIDIAGKELGMTLRIEGDDDGAQGREILLSRSNSAPLSVALLGDPSKAKEMLGWESQIMPQQMVNE
jgi:GDP-D-mannose dehydratase